MREVKLADGRRLTWAEHGDPEGRPVLYFHGYPGSRMEPRAGAQDAEQAGVRLIAIDRPGFGGSTFQPGRRIVDWPADVTAVADSLGLERFPVMGVSGGGPYAAVCAHSIPERLSGAAIVCGLGPLDVPEVTRGMMRRNRLLLRVARWAPWLLRILMAQMARAFRKNPDKLLAQMRRVLPEPDVRLMEDPEMLAVFLESAVESFRQGTRAAVQEGGLYVRSWGFRLEDIPIRVHLFQGEQDVNVPVAMARYQARVIPQCVPHYYPDEGHVSLVLNRARDIYAALGLIDIGIRAHRQGG